MTNFELKEKNPILSNRMTCRAKLRCTCRRFEAYYFYVTSTNDINKIKDTVFQFSVYLHTNEQYTCISNYNTTIYGMLKHITDSLSQLPGSTVSSIYE